MSQTGKAACRRLSAANRSHLPQRPEARLGGDEEEVLSIAVEGAVLVKVTRAAERLLAEELCAHVRRCACNNEQKRLLAPQVCVLFTHHRGTGLRVSAELLVLS